MNDKKDLDSRLQNRKNVSRIEMLDRALSVIEYIFKNKDVSFSMILKDLKISKSTLFRILYTLESHNYIKKDKETGRYSLGTLFVFYGEEVKYGLTLIKICEDILSTLANKVGESVNLNILYKELVLNVLSVEGEKSVLTSRLIPISPLNCSATGKIFLARKNNLELMNYFASDAWEKRTMNSITTYEDFLKEKEKILKDEISYDNEEYEYGLLCLAMPLRNHKGLMDAVISITGPLTRIKMKGIDELSEELKNSVNTINNILIKTKYTY
ncbi:MAG: IclR family transcriptional regulator [Bacilli bacterium]